MSTGVDGEAGGKDAMDIRIEMNAIGDGMEGSLSLKRRMS